MVLTDTHSRYQAVADDALCTMGVCRVYEDMLRPTGNHDVSKLWVSHIMSRPLVLASYLGVISVTLATSLHMGAGSVTARNYKMSQHDSGCLDNMHTSFSERRQWALPVTKHERQ